jgi:hypothetical protein
MSSQQMQNEWTRLWKGVREDSSPETSARVRLKGQDQAEKATVQLQVERGEESAGEGNEIAERHYKQGDLDGKGTMRDVQGFDRLGSTIVGRRNTCVIRR